MTRSWTREVGFHGRTSPVGLVLLVLEVEQAAVVVGATRNPNTPRTCVIAMETVCSRGHRSRFGAEEVEFQ